MLMDFLALSYDLPTAWPEFEDSHEADPDGAAGGVRLVLDEVARSFGERQVLRDINLEIAPGEFVSVIGRSGCGKSTLLRLLAGLDDPTSGRISLDAADGCAPTIRLMFQEPRLLPWASVAANVEVGLCDARRRLAAAPRLGRRALASVGLADRANDWPHKLSGGQRQRVALARALVGVPHLLLLDEPLGALDALTRLEMQRLVESFWIDRGFTAVLVTHDVNEAVMLSDRVLLLESGAVAEEVAINLPRPRDRGDPVLVELEQMLLGRVLGH